MDNTKSYSKEVEAALSNMLQNYADKFGVERRRFSRAVKPLIQNPRFEERQSVRIRSKGKKKSDLHFDLLAPFVEIFSLLPSDQAIGLLGKYAPEELAKRIAFAHELADPNGCFYDLDDWEVAIGRFIDHQDSLSDSLRETGYPDKLFETSPWLDRMIGCLYPVKYKYNLPDGAWTTKTKFERFGPGSICKYRDANYFTFLDSETAARIDIPQFRDKILTLRSDALNCLLLHLRQRRSGKIPLEMVLKLAVDCLGKGQNYIDHETITFLRSQDELFDDLNEMLPVYNNTKLHVRAGGLRDLARVIGQATMELAMRPHSNIRARLSFYKADAPRVGLTFDLTVFYQDYAQDEGRGFEPMYQAWESNKPEQEAYSKRFWEEVDQAFNLYDTVFISHSTGERPADKLLFVEDDYSVVYNGESYKLPERHFKALKFMAESQKKGIPEIHKEAIFSAANMLETKTKMSVKKWFTRSGGDPKRLVMAGLIETRPHGKCRLNVASNLIEFLPSSLPETD